MSRCAVVAVTAAVLLVALLLQPSQAALTRAKGVAHPDYPDACWLEEEQQAVAINSTMQLPFQCQEYSCAGEGDNLLLTLEQCGAVGAPEGCKNEVDLTKPYPDCCINFVCPGNR